MADLSSLSLKGTLFDSSAPPAVRRPAFAMQFGGGGGAGGGLGGLTGSAASALGMGGGGADPWQETVIAITVTTGLAPAVNTADVWLAAGERAPEVAVGDTGSISLGYEDSPPEPVFTGRVEAVRRDFQGRLRLTATDGGAALSRLRVNKSYEGQAGGEIVRDLAGEAEVDTATVEPGSQFPFYVMDDRRSAYDQIASLARKCGFLAYVTPAGELSFAPPSAGGQAIQTFTYGVDILALEVTEGEPPLGAVTIVGEGAAGSQGQDAWSWLIKDPSAVKGTAGSGGPARIVSDPSLRSAAAAQQAADGAAAAAAALATMGTLLAPGAPAVAVGLTIEIASAPEDSLNGTYMVRAVRHRYDKDAGFTTLIQFSATPSASGAAGLLGGLI
jgi:phage protein D